ncbi:hypothetical protein [Rhizobium rhizogenes]|uniref:Uncharacterized protein n=1 Tax=Rhizobium rhizogenes (strain K84 / ATCC BAA-868) TaxID=311403 RepID=B9JKQ6_RHIR8|nr:hypothetical protein [Rhizobium rhizogenes]ACM30498.1 hypothetical protein Arad_9459 [Rhizobium rhizogenes K84]OCJ15845.1 hypothetical protein A6U88_15350 [Agrobacterium sp. B131/95]MDJ1633969.1 hypothetical protein [Rhizobium rhizogenes]NTG51118.1 hypothetical protein [Rhizobium rhizogenes]NTG77422.1 hypothetical protein [Rhizobium rhizogenes]
MTSNESDRSLIETMRRYFVVKADVSELKARLETARREAGEDIETFYNPRTNPNHAIDILRSHVLKKEMVSLMSQAEAWAGGADVAQDFGQNSDAIQDADIVSAE